MQHHTPDPRWAIFNAPDFESYAKVFVVRGRFHQDVPEDVVKSYAVAEQIMTQAYYHYPMYEEALVKSLRTLEMAVRIRCEQLGIKMTYTDKKGRDKPQDFSPLIDQLAKIEKAKPNKNTLHGLRELRNIFMHPKEDMLMGSIALNAIRHTLVQLNALFLPEQYFADAQRTLDAMQKKWQSLEKGPMILAHAGKNSLLFESSLVEAYPTGAEWVYLCAFYDVFNDTKETLEQFAPPTPIIFVLREVSIMPEIISGKDVADGTPVVLLSINHPGEQAVLEQFRDELASVEELALRAYHNSLARDVESAKVKCRCEYWGQ